MQPANAECAKDILEIEIFGCSLRDGGVCSVGAAHSAADAEASLGEVQAVSADSADTVSLLPVDQVCAYAALLDEILHEFADFVVSESGDNSSIHAEALVQAADNVVLAAAFPCAERTCCADASLTGIKAEHYFAKADCVIFVGSLRFKIKFHSASLLNISD